MDSTRVSPKAKHAARDSAAAARRKAYNDAAAYARNKPVVKEKKSFNPFNRIAEALRGKKKP